MIEQQKQNIAPEFSPAVQHALGKLNVRMTDLMEQINIVIKLLVDENMELHAKLDKLPQQQSKKE